MVVEGIKPRGRRVQGVVNSEIENRGKPSVEWIVA